MVEWYVNSADGVEHGLTLAAPPAGTDGSTVELTFALRGSLTPELDASGRGAAPEGCQRRDRPRL